MYLLHFLIDIFFYVDFKSTIGFRRSHVVFELWRVKIAIKIFCFVKIKIVLFNYLPNQT